MIKRLGLIFGVFFILLSLINYLNNPVIYRINVLGIFIAGLVFICSIKIKSLAKIIQPILLLTYGSLAIIENDVNSVAPIICYIFVIGMVSKYFTKLKILKFYIPLPYFFIALLTGWGILEILASVLLYIALTTILYIIQNDHV